VGYKLVKFNVVPDENEQIDAIIKMPKEPRSVIHGVVLDECNKPMKDAVVKLLKEYKHDAKRLEPITHTFTDEHGQFLFGPLCPHEKYVIKVWINHVKIREIIIKPENCSNDCIRGNENKKDVSELSLDD
jgi:protocatechuate 3,4-dioxygenase beta subunit